MTTAIIGAGSEIARALVSMLPDHEEIVRVPRGDQNVPPLDCERYLFCAGLQFPMKLTDQLDKDRRTSMDVNLLWPMEACERVLSSNRRARICIVGSEAAYSWCYDGVYAAAKAALHAYVEGRRLEHSGQQLVCVAPWCIEDCGMTTRRLDQDRVDCRRAEHPKGRLLSAHEVAAMIHHLLYVDEGYTTGTVVRMHGGVGGRL